MNQQTGLTVRIREFWVKYHWPILAVLGFLSALVELLKFAAEPDILDDVLRIVELLVQGIILPILLITLQRVEIQKNAMENLLSLHDALVYQLNKAQNWDELFEVIGQFTQNIIPLSGISLLMQAPNSNRFDFEFVSVFDTSLHMADAPNSLKLNDAECCQDGSAALTGLRVCNCQLKLQIEENKTSYHRYCLPLPSTGSFLGVLHLYLPISYKLSQEQRDFFGSIVPEVVLSITNANLKRTGELREAAFETEKLRMASDLHDTLGQDLAYLRNKIDQLIQSPAANGAALDEDLNQMFIVAEEANQTVRNILAVTRSNQGSALGDRMLAYAKAIGERAKLNMVLESQGQVQILSQHIQFQVFLIFREVLANIEKHAGARQVNIALSWSEDELVIGITDDGRGFLTDQLDQRDHYGLTIIETRTRELNGQLSIISAPNEGTKMSIRVPISHDEIIHPIESEK